MGAEAPDPLVTMVTDEGGAQVCEGRVGAACSGRKGEGGVSSGRKGEVGGRGPLSFTISWTMLKLNTDSHKII